MKYVALRKFYQHLLGETSKNVNNFKVCCLIVFTFAVGVKFIL